MGVLANLFSKKKSRSVVLVDIAARSVGGACVLLAEGEKPAILFSRRFPIEIKTSEKPKAALLRALTVLAETLVRDGAPAIQRVVGSGSVDAVHASIDPPWEETELRTAHLDQNEPFVFTKTLAKAALEHERAEEDGENTVEERIVGITLNGYSAPNPFGRSAHRASLSVLSSRINRAVAEEILNLFKTTYHTTNVTYTSGVSLRLQTLRQMFPHEKDAILLDTDTTATSLVFMRGGLPVALSKPASAPSWTKGVREVLVECAKQFPLPRTLLLLSRNQECVDEDCAELRSLASLTHGKLWLSETPPTIIPVLTSQCSRFVQHRATTPPDLALALAAHYWGSAASAEQTPL
jgi:hypothetical protein